MPKPKTIRRGTLNNLFNYLKKSTRKSNSKKKQTRNSRSRVSCFKGRKC